MKDTVGSALREAWRAKGNPECIHSELSLERSCSGVVTGAYVCTTCGALVNTVNSRRDAGIKPMGR
jgi:hypothetical protein